MQPTQPSTQTNGFTPKWRIFSPLARVWVQNPFDHDIVFQVADEYNRPYKYVLRAGKPAELPGGSIATLGVKQIVDQLILSTKGDEAHMHDPLVRAKHEATVILRVKETAPLADAGPAGEIDLSVRSEDPTEEETTTMAQPEEAFPGLNAAPALDPLPASAKAGLDDLIGASLPSSDSVASPNNAHDNAEG